MPNFEDCRIFTFYCQSRFLLFCCFLLRFLPVFFFLSLPLDLFEADNISGFEVEAVRTVEVADPVLPVSSYLVFPFIREDHLYGAVQLSIFNGVLPFCPVVLSDRFVATCATTTDVQICSEACGQPITKATVLCANCLKNVLDHC